MKKYGWLLALPLALLVTGCGGTNYSKLETALKSDASSYYEKDLKGFVNGVTQHKIDLAMLEKSGVSIKEFTDAKCDKSSYALILLTLDKDRKVVGDYKVENHLTCGTYKTASK